MTTSSAKAGALFEQAMQDYENLHLERANEKKPSRLWDIKEMRRKRTCCRKEHSSCVIELFALTMPAMRSWHQRHCISLKPSQVAAAATLCRAHITARSAPC
jgi:hypothetical protein